MSFRSKLRQSLIRKDFLESKTPWEPMLSLCTTGMIASCLLIGLFGGAVGLALMFYAFDKSPADTDPLSIGDGIGIISGFFLFAAFFPMAIALGIAKAILMKMEEDRKEQL